MFIFSSNKVYFTDILYTSTKLSRKNVKNFNFFYDKITHEKKFASIQIELN